MSTPSAALGPTGRSTTYAPPPTPRCSLPASAEGVAARKGTTIASTRRSPSKPSERRFPSLAETLPPAPQSSTHLSPPARRFGRMTARAVCRCTVPPPAATRPPFAPFWPQRRRAARRCCLHATLTGGRRCTRPWPSAAAARSMLLRLSSPSTKPSRLRVLVSVLARALQ